MTRLLGLSVLALIGCEAPAKDAACTSFADMQITNPDGLAPADDQTDLPGYVELVVGFFAADTGADGVCVDEVRLVPWPDDAEAADLPGAYLGSRIELAYVEAAWEFLPTTIVHELCHAFDRAHGYPSDEPTLFGDLGEEPFAEACARGSRPYVVEASVEAACGVDLGAETQRYVNEQVYAAITYPDVPAEGTTPIALDRRAFEAAQADRAWSVVASASAVYLTEWTTDGSAATRVSEVDPTTGEVTAVWELAELFGKASVLPAEDGPPVLIEWGEDARYWRLAADGTVTSSAIPDLYYTGSGVVVGDTAWVFGAMFLGGDYYPMARLDLLTGEWTAIDFPTEVYAMEWWGDLAIEGGRMHVPAVDEGEPVLVSFDAATEAWTTSPLPARFRSVLPLPDGRTLMSWTGTLQAYGDDTAGLAVIEADGTWRLADDACDADATATDPQLLLVGGAPYLWEPADGWDHGDDWSSHVVTRVTVD